MPDQPSTDSKDWTKKPGLRNVVVGVVVNVKVLGIQADSDEEAVEKAIEHLADVGTHDLFKQVKVPHPSKIDYVEWAEDYASCLVDHMADKEYEHSLWYKIGPGGKAEIE